MRQYTLKSLLTVILLILVVLGSIFFISIREHDRIQKTNHTLSKSLAQFREYDKFMSLLICNNTVEALNVLNRYADKYDIKDSNTQKSVFNGYRLFWFKEGNSIPTFTTITVEARKSIYSTVDDELFFKAFSDSIAYDSVTSRTMSPYRLFQTLNEILPETANSTKYYTALLAAGRGYMDDERYWSGVRKVYAKSASLPPVIFAGLPLREKILSLCSAEEWLRIIDEMENHGNLDKLSQDHALLYRVLVCAYQNSGQTESAEKLRLRLEAEKIEMPKDFIITASADITSGTIGMETDFR